MNEPRDTLVGDALRRLDIPDHEPLFWERLEARLVDGRSETGTDEPEPVRAEEMTVVDLQSSPAARRAAAAGNRTPMLALAAAVAVVVALVVGLGVFGSDSDDESEVDMAGETDGGAAPVRVPDTIDPELAPPETTTSVVPGEDLDAYAEQTAAAWIEALFAGDTEAAYGLLDDQTRADLDPAEFEELSSGLFEGAAAFAAEGIARTVVAVPADAGEFHVVTFTGDVEREGMVETAGYPVVVTSSGVHLTMDGPQLELDPEYAGSSGTTLASPLEVLVSDTADAWLWIDAAAPERFSSPGRLVLDVEDAAGPGTHVVSLVAIEGERITARTFTVVAP